MILPKKLPYGVVIAPRRASLSYWSAVVGVVFLPLLCSHLLNFILNARGEVTYSYWAALPMSFALPFIGGTPSPCCRLPSPADRLQKNTPARAFFIYSPSQGYRLLLVPISLNTYLANHEFTSYRSFAAVSVCFASILYPHRSLFRL